MLWGLGVQLGEGEGDGLGLVHDVTGEGVHEVVGDGDGHGLPNRCPCRYPQDGLGLGCLCFGFGLTWTHLVKPAKSGVGSCATGRLANSRCM